MTTTKPSTCLNCQTTMAGHFCPHCGQKASANKRLKFSEVYHDFMDNVFNFDKGILFSLWHLIVRPGFVGRNYINGQRKKYTNPVRFLIIAIAFQAFVDFWIIKPQLNEIPDFIYFSFLSAEINQQMSAWNYILAIKYSFLHNLSMILLFPAIFIFTFRKLKYNFTELLTINFYFFSAGLLLTVSVLALCAAIGYQISIPSIIAITFSYIIWSTMLFFSSVSFWKRLFKVFISILIFMLLRIFLLIYLLSLIAPLEQFHA